MLFRSQFSFFVDYRDLNKVTEDDCFPMTDLNSVLDRLRKVKYITKIDLKSAFMQVNLKKSSRKYTASAIQDSGLYQFKRMLFGLKGLY